MVPMPPEQRCDVALRVVHGPGFLGTAGKLSQHALLQTVNAQRGLVLFPSRCTGGCLLIGNGANRCQRNGAYAMFTGSQSLLDCAISVSGHCMVAAPPSMEYNGVWCRQFL